MDTTTTTKLHINKLTYTPLLPFTHTTTPKFSLEYCYYMDGSFIPPKQIDEITWLLEIAAYGVSNVHKHIEISKRLSRLQNILRAELMAFYDTIKLSLELYHNEPVHIFTDSLNSLYLPNTQIRHHSLHHNHPNKTILSEMIQMLQQRTTTFTIYKARVHSNITGNDKVDELAKARHELEHREPIFPYEDAHSIPYFLHKDFWLGNMSHTPYKGPI